MENKPGFQTLMSFSNEIHVSKSRTRENCERILETLREKCPNMELLFGPYKPVFTLNTGKYGQEITPYLDTFQAVKG